MAIIIRNQEMLDKLVFAGIIHNTPLVSLDFLVENTKGEFLLGMRTNRPAKDYWFVPGGRILKNETLDEGFNRLTKTELGLEISLKQAQYHGLYEHFYPDNVFADEPEFQHISTHYIVNVFRVKLLVQAELPLRQHNAYKWFMPEQLLQDKQVHEYSKWYFK